MMYSNSNKIRSIELPENLFSNLGASKKPKIVPTIEKTDTEIKVDNNYRDRITNKYNKIDDLTLKKLTKNNQTMKQLFEELTTENKN